MKTRHKIGTHLICETHLYRIRKIQNKRNLSQTTKRVFISKVLYCVCLLKQLPTVRTHCNFMQIQSLKSLSSHRVLLHPSPVKIQKRKCYVYRDISNFTNFHKTGKMNFTIHGTLHICNNGCMGRFHCLRSWAPAVRCMLVHLHPLGILMFFYV